MCGEVSARPVATDARLPSIIDLNKFETVWFEVLRGILSKFRQMLLIACTGVFFHVPGTVSRGTGRESHRIHVCDGSGIRLQAKPRVIEVAKREQFPGSVLARLDAKPAVVYLRFMRTVLSTTGEKTTPLPRSWVSHPPTTPARVSGFAIARNA